MKLVAKAFILICLILTGGVSSLVSAQATAVEVTASDGLVLRGDFYLVDTNRPTVLLLHQLYTSRASWQPYIGAFTGAGFNVLAVDMRGHGQTRGRINWQAAITDTNVWTNWLRTTAGVRGDAISMLGSSMGSALAIVGCAQDPACRTAVAISPGWNYNGVPVQDALQNGLAGRKILVVYAQRDRYPALGVPRMVEVAPDALKLQTYPGNTHGMNLVKQEAETILPVIINWLGANGG